MATIYILSVMGIILLTSLLNDDPPMESTSFKFEMFTEVLISVSGEHGQVIGRAEFAHSENSYFIRYVNGDGRANEVWWGESALQLNVSQPVITKN